MRYERSVIVPIRLEQSFQETVPGTMATSSADDAAGVVNPKGLSIEPQYLPNTEIYLWVMEGFSCGQCRMVQYG